MEYPLFIEVENTEESPLSDKRVNLDKSIAEHLTVQLKEQERLSIAADVEAFLNAGGVIQELPPGKSTTLDSDDLWGMFSL